jgi:rubrerythrin
MQPRTHERLMTAMRGEAFAYAKYRHFANAARARGHEELAVLFERTAETELWEHFAEEAELAGFIGSDVENLRAAVSGEAYEVDTMYQQFAADARQDGDTAVAERFTEVREDERRHREAFAAALTRLEALNAPPQR